MRDIHRLFVALNLLSNLAGQFFVVSGQEMCLDVAERWCEISPTYSTLNINPEHSETIICTIPSTPGAWSTINFVNQFGHRVTDLHNVDLYLIDSSSSDTETSYHANISWTFDKDIRERLKAIQCISNFQGRSRPYKTSIVSINFVDIEQEPTTVTTVTTLLPTTQTIQTTTKNSDCVCTPSQCAQTMNPELDRSSNNELLQLSTASQGFELPCIINSFKILFSIFFVLLCSIC